MSLGLTHFAIGAAGMLLLQPLLCPTVRFKRTLVVASGLWALVPDLHYVIPTFPDVFNGPRAVYGNAFWFHTFLDGVVQGRGTQRNAAIALALITAAAIVGDSGLLDRRRWIGGDSTSESPRAENRYADDPGVESQQADDPAVESRHVDGPNVEDRHVEHQRAEQQPADGRCAESENDGRSVPSAGER